MDIKFLVVYRHRPRFAVPELRIDTVEYHRNLLKNNEKVSVYGGGKVEINPEEKTVEFLGKSADYGQPDITQLKIALKSSLDEVKFILDMKGDLFYGEDFNINDYDFILYGENIGKL